MDKKHFRTLHVSGKKRFIRFGSRFRGWMDWDIKAQQLLRMCQAVRAAQFFKNINHFLTIVTGLQYKCTRGTDGVVGGVSALRDQRIRLRCLRAGTPHAPREFAPGA